MLFFFYPLFLFYHDKGAAIKGNWEEIEGNHNNKRSHALEDSIIFVFIFRFLFCIKSRMCDERDFQDSTVFTALLRHGWSKGIYRTFSEPQLIIIFVGSDITDCIPQTVKHQNSPVMRYRLGKLSKRKTDSVTELTALYKFIYLFRCIESAFQSCIFFFLLL